MVPPTSAPGNTVVAAGLAVLLVSVSVGMNNVCAGGLVLLSFLGVLAGVSLVAVGVADDPAARMGAALFAGARAVAVFRHRNLSVMGLLMASSAVTVVSGDASPVLCFAMFTVFLLGLSLINIRAVGSSWMH